MYRPTTIMKRDFSSHGLLVACNLCGSRNHDLITKRDQNGYRTYKVLCHECGLIYTTPLPTLIELRSFHETQQTKNLTKELTPKLKHVYEHSRRAITRYNRIKPFIEGTAKILDINALGGEFAYLCTKMNHKVTGLSSNHHIIDYAKKELCLNIQYSFLNNGNLKNQKFDFICSYHSLNHSLDPLSTMLEYRDMLDENGLLNIEVPSIESNDGPIYNRFKFKYFYNFNLYTIQALCKKSGFEIVDIEVIANSMHINLLLKKSSIQKVNIKSNKNYNELSKAVFGYKNLNYYISKDTYFKAFNSIYNYLCTQQQYNQYSSPKAVLDRYFNI